VKSERQIIFHGEYFQDFFTAQTYKVREKIAYVLQLVRTVERVPEKFLKHIESMDGLYEIRVEVGSDIFRIFCCFDRGNLVVLFNGFQKKTQKTPRFEIETALRLVKEYFAEEGAKDEKRRSDKKGKNVR
jgi:phage-related protein